MSYVKFEKHPKPPERKTDVWAVVNLSGHVLGQVRWHGAWRKYTFHPVETTIFDVVCLREIADFLFRSQREYMDKYNERMAPK